MRAVPDDVLSALSEAYRDRIAGLQKGLKRLESH